MRHGEKFPVLIFKHVVDNPRQAKVNFSTNDGHATSVHRNLGCIGKIETLPILLIYA